MLRTPFWAIGGGVLGRLRNRIGRLVTHLRNDGVGIGARKVLIVEGL